MWVYCGWGLWVGLVGVGGVINGNAYHSRCNPHPSIHTLNPPPTHTRRTLFPLFQKYVTKGYVSEEEAGKRLAQVVSDPSLDKSGVYWSWSNTKGAFENQVSEEVADDGKGVKLWEISEKLVGLKQ